ncbi:MAG: Ig-like domain-containing protein, partial [Anaeromyxobacteraceae bacterium]
PDAVRAGHDDATAPTVSIDVPKQGATLGGSVTIAATAYDSVGVTQVAFYVDGVYLSADSAAPYSVTWDTAAFGNGPRTLIARAYDAAGNEGQSASVEVTLENPGFAVFDPATGAPRCSALGPVCDSGPVLEGRGPVGPERNAPNTIGLPCADGASGFFHIDESLDAIRVATLDGSPLAVGKGVEVRVKAWAYADFTHDSIDVYVARDANAPVWELVTTLHPEGAGEQTLTFRHTLGEGGLQAFRAALRFDGSPATCTDGIYDDRDDLVFAVGAGTPDLAKPVVHVAAPLAGAVLGGATRLAAIATDDRAVVSRVELMVDGAIVGTSTAPLPGTDRFEVPWNAASVADGPHTITARAVDGAGNAETSAAVGFQVADVVSPTVVIATPEADDSVGGIATLTADAWDDRAVTSVTFLAGGVVIGERTAPPWTLGWDTAAASGYVTLTARARDAAGHATLSAPVVVYVDHVAPTVEITSPLDGDVVAASTILSAKIGDVVRGIANIRKVEFLANGTVIATDARSYPTAPCTATWRSGSYPNGSYALVAKAYDAAGNVGTSAPITVEVKDSTPPAVSIVAPPAGGTVRGIAEVTASATDDGLMKRVQLTVGAAAPVDFTAPPYSVRIDTATLADGKYTATATAWDGAGNSATVASDFWVDNTPPVVTLTAPAAAASVSGTYTLKATATDGQLVDHVEFWVGDAVLATVATAPFEVDWATTALDNGTWNVAAIAYDAAGNAHTSAIVPVTVWNATTADFDVARKVPACATVGPSCFSGTAVDSRAALALRAELHAPNTLDGCVDGELGQYHVDESIDQITIRTLDGASLAPGKTVSVDVDFFAVSPDLDRVDLFYAADASAPAWVWFATVAPTSAGLQTISGSYVLPTGPVQAVRAAARYAESGPSACAPGSFDDRDDLVFAVNTPGADLSLPTVSIQNPVDGGTVHGTVLVKANAADDRGVARVEFAVDGVVVATDAVAPWELEWDSASVANGSHAVVATAYDTSGNHQASNPVFVTVASATNALYDASLLAPACFIPSSFCDSGALVEGRGLLGPELNAPNTLGGTCPDGELGTYLQEESIERIVLRTGDGGGLAPGKQARVEVTVFASSAYGADALDLYQATVAGSPSWRHVATLLPSRAGTQVLSTTYVLPPGALQAVRARFRYGGAAASCGTVLGDGTVVADSYDDHDDLAFSVPFTPNAARDAALKVPRCTDGKFYCDSGALLDGRAALGPEANSPNTLRSGCADGATGAYHVAPSTDAIRIYTAGATPLAAGKPVVAEVEIFASDAWVDEAIDLYLTNDALAPTPSWTYAATLTPHRAGRQVLSVELVLGTGAVQAIRASHRAATATANACSSGSTDDHDDLAFGVAP